MVTGLFRTRDKTSERGGEEKRESVAASTQIKRKGCGRSFFCARPDKGKTRMAEGAQIYFVIFHLSIQSAENHLPFRCGRATIESVVIHSSQV